MMYSMGWRMTWVKWSGLSLETFCVEVSFDGNYALGFMPHLSSNEVRLGINTVKKPGRLSATASMHEYPFRERWEILWTVRNTCLQFTFFPCFTPFYPLFQPI